VELDMDTGSPAGIALPADFASRLPLAGPPSDSKPDRRIDRVLAAKEARLGGPAAIGKFDLGSPVIRFVEGSSQGVVGSEILARFAITLDAKNHRIRLEEPGPPVAKSP
jgi:hypothetical protein